MLRLHKLLAYAPKQCVIKAFSPFKASKRFFKMDGFVWIDMEMSGLDPEQHRVLEIACIITTPELKVVDEKGINLVIHQPNEILESMNDWCLKQHAKTGLIESSKRSNISEFEADEQVAKYITDHMEGIRYLAGNSVYMDRLFLMKYFPKTNDLLHYRILDVSTIKILCGHWYPDKIGNLSEKKSIHRALPDIKQSLQELLNYKREIFK